MLTNTKAGLLYRAELAIDNSLSDSGIRELVAAYGYSEDKLREGRTLLDAAQTASSSQLLAVGQQQQGTVALEQANRAARDAYQALAKIARAVCDKPSLTILGLSGNEPRSTGEFMKAAFNLFDNAPKVPVLAGFGYDAARLTAGRAVIMSLQSADQAQEAAKGAAQQASLRQQAAFKALDAWTAQYIKIARVALRQVPQQLEKLGVAARTAPTAAQRAARQKKTPPAPS